MKAKALVTVWLIFGLANFAHAQSTFDPSKISAPSIFYFYQPGCLECQAKSKVLSEFLAKHPEVKLYEFDVTQPSNQLLLEQFCETASIPDTERLIAPSVFLGDTGIVGESITLKALEEVYKRRKLWTKPLVNVEKAVEQAESRIQKFTVWAVVLAGLADGVNPCAFATLMFFITYLLMAGHSRRKAAIASVGFIAGVFVIYLAIGLGFCKLLCAIHKYRFVKPILHFGFGGAALLFALLSVRDAWLAAQGRHRDMVLQLSTQAKQRIHSRIRDYARSSALAIGAFVTGAVVSVVELACTGQVYLPTISLVITSSERFSKAFVLLLLYNLMFIMPLVLIALIATSSLSVRKLGKWLESHNLTFKLILAAAFLALGVLLILTGF